MWTTGSAQVPVSGRPPTLRSIAQAVGVSTQTVSNVINEPSKVAPATLAAVRAEIERVGYRPSRAARQLRTRRSHTLGFRMRAVSDGINRSILDRLLHALIEQADARDYAILVFASTDDDNEIEDILRLRADSGVDGFLLTETAYADTRAERLHAADIPFASFGRPWGRPEAEGPGEDWVDIAGCEGIVDAVHALHEDGARRIGFIGWPEGSGTGDDRFDGFSRAMSDLGLATDLVERCEDGFETGRAAAEALVGRGADALVCVSDSLALGALATMRGARRTDIMRRITGFDDTPVARTIGLSSVDQPVEEAAAVMVQSLVHRIEHPGEPLPSALPRLIRPRFQRREPV